MTIEEALRECGAVVGFQARMLSQRSRCDVRDLETIGRTAVWRAWLSWREGRAPFRAYASKFVRHAMIDELRFHRQAWGRARRSPQFCELEDALEVPAPAPEAFDRSLRWLWCRRLLAGLSPRQRRILTLAYFHGMTSREIAAADGLSWKYVEQARTTAIVRIRQGAR